jgi:hypothetical protein
MCSIGHLLHVNFLSARITVRLIRETHPSGVTRKFVPDEFLSWPKRKNISREKVSSLTKIYSCDTQAF